MATKKKRISIPLSPEADSVLHELSLVSGKSYASLVSELLDESLSSLRVITTAYRLSKRSKKAAFRKLAEGVGDEIKAQRKLQRTIKKELE